MDHRGRGGAEPAAGRRALVHDRAPALHGLVDEPRALPALELLEHCPAGPETAISAAKPPARTCKSARERRFTVKNVKTA